MAKRLLVAEDDRFLGNAYRMKLTKAGYDFKLVSDGEEALAVIDDFKPDVMLLDLVMPKKDGFSTLEEIRKNKKFKDLPIIVASNLGQKEDLDRAKILGATDYIVKSDISMEDIVTKVNKFSQ